MTLRNCRITEAETYDELLRNLALEHVFERVVGNKLDEFDVRTDDRVPITIVTEVLEAADDVYYLDVPETGRNPRYRVIECPQTNSSE